MGKSTTELTIKFLKQRNLPYSKCEYWNPFSKTRHDLFGFIDIVAIKDGKILGIQATSWGNMKARASKIIESPNSIPWLASGGDIQVWGWEGKVRKIIFFWYNDNTGKIESKLTIPNDKKL